MTHTYLSRPQKCLSLLGLWFVPDKHVAIYLIYRAFQILIQYSFLLFNFIYMGIVWGDLEEVSEGLYLLFAVATVCIKVTTVLVNWKRFHRLVKFMETDIFASQTPVHERIMSVQAERMWRVYTIFLLCGLTNCTEWACVPLFENNGQRFFPFKIWMPADPSKLVHYVIGYAYQVWAVYFSATIFLTIDYITVSMITFAIAQIEIIVEKLKNIQNVPLENLDFKSRRDLIKNNNITLNECIRQHQAVIRFVKLVKNMFNLNIFFQLSGTVAIICIICFRITIEPSNSFHFYSTLNYLVTMLAQLYLYCWCGNELTDRSQVLRDALYKTPWYEQDKKFNRTLRIAMDCMKKPIIFRAGYYIPLSRPTFVSILRCSYSYFAVLNQAHSDIHK